MNSEPYKLECKLNLFIFLFLIFVFASSSVQAERGDINSGKSEIAFYGNSNFHSFQGKIKSVKGFVYGDSRDFKSINYLQLEFDPLSFDTSNQARDENLRKTLSAKKHPIIRFRSTNVLVSHDGGLADITGKLTIRDITKRVVFTAYLSKNTPKELRAKGSFWIKLSDYNLKPSSPAFIRVNDRIQVKFDAVANWSH